MLLSDQDRPQDDSLCSVVMTSLYAGGFDPVGLQVVVPRRTQGGTSPDALRKLHPHPRARIASRGAVQSSTGSR